MKRTVVFFAFLLSVLIANSKVFKFYMYDANDENYEINVDIDVVNNQVYAEHNSQPLFSFKFYGYRIFKEKNRLGLSMSKGLKADVEAISNSYFIVIRDNGNIVAKVDGTEFPMRSRNNYSTAETYDKLINALRESDKQQSALNRSFNVNGTTFTMSYIQGGSMQRKTKYVGASDFINLDSYYIGQTEVTQDLWQAVMGTNPSYFKGGNLPVENVSWDDCQAFIKKLNSLTGQTFRLPTDSEWEYAASGGVMSKGYLYSGNNNLAMVAWFKGNACNELEKGSNNYGTHSVASKQCNEIGLYDMSGNVWEWCQDWYSDYNANGSSSAGRVIRGGCWYGSVGCLIATRSQVSPNTKSNCVGLRLAL